MKTKCAVVALLSFLVMSGPLMIVDVAAESNEVMTVSCDAQCDETDDTILTWGWWANKNLIGKYVWNDVTGLNWLLNKTGYGGTIEDIISTGTGIYIVANGTSYLITGAMMSTGIVGWMITAGVFVYGGYTTIMQKNAEEKLEVVFQLVANQKNYAVYETTVMWNTVPNGYDVEEW